MSSIMVHGYAQIWNKRTGMSEPQGVFIEAVKGRKNFKLLIYLRTGRVKTLKLNNNIKSVILQSYGANLSSLHVTFQNDGFLFVEKLSSTEAKQLKAFLDSVHQNCPEPHMSPDKGEGPSTCTGTQTRKTSLPKVREESGEGCSGTDKNRKRSAHRKKPLATSKSSTLTNEELENQQRKKKRMLPSDSEVNENEKSPIKKNIVREKSNANPLKYKSYTWKKQIKPRKFKSNEKLASLLKANYLEKPSVDDTDLQFLTKSTLRQFQLALKCSEGGSKLGLPRRVYQQTVWQGLPNLGNTCYINAVLQSLCSIPLFVNDVLNQGFPWGRISHDIFSLCVALLLTMKDIFNMRIKEKLLVTIIKAISVVAEIFPMDAQNDAHEFLSYCLGQMKEALQKPNVVLDSENEFQEENSPQQVFAGDSAAGVPDCPVMTNFECELLHSIFCKACGQAIYKTEPSNYLSINLLQGMRRRPLSIQSTFDHFFATEELEYKCENCKHKRSVVVHKFSRLPRVLIIHLKRYCFNEFLSLRKDDQAVTVNKYLDLSSHCKEDTKPPVPLSKNAHIRDLQLLKLFQKLSLTVICSLSSVKSKSKNSVAKRVKAGKKPEPQKSQHFLKGKRRAQQQKDQGKPCMRESESTCLGDGASVEKKQLAISVMNLEDTSLPLSYRYADKPARRPDTEAQFPGVPEHPKLKKSKKSNRFAESDFDSVSQTTEDFSKNKKARVSERSQTVAEPIDHPDGMEIHKGDLQQILPEGFPMPDAQEHRMNLRGCKELNPQKANPGNKDILVKKTESRTQKPGKKADGKGPHTYRLIGIISHLGNSHNSGHYISDVYDFKKQVWFTYNDLLVSRISESLVQKARLCTGYIFFYMHNEIFEELLLRIKTSQSQFKCEPKSRSTKARKRS
ncbi:ubiquitin carboxyl-terminal hydrolase 26 [Heterocephalus glaber]|uniref:Ubiquitin carboxyl-terminal hydrolase n=1 Tax=Heterocephalus glaber TaxID=10181 RepID=A0AAX6RJR6_HETGA|nr:ubiquitin carboxyl-terminal hydrolase 26 [Heterocephalus glaber]XP_021096273.1 ubiquitin carboxyl-terminal hydrolase 26 [Heterocephalus glaber]XP_021096274.1 ubiquitin carboxyl-terminal hydrolase 26 [Heterocephalus glaber]XP_021096275.1 ubiquitin carboxyl-terminal hydrolase 26 [Heterocephalus glaber]XP_021096276.1 ubiquitin carboxyl-terminal hydrolase 26 [Heterocephalus glaber]XP_021096277.1 ubiquitin carboxyl-terminal hydrolase 26 [Heterocephalus glaber]